MPTQDNLIEITVWYRGVVEGRLARQIAGGLADAAEREGKYVQAFENYVDLPDRVYVPCRAYARISREPIAEPYLYENHNPYIVVCTDAALVKGCNVLKGIEPGGTLIVNTSQEPETVLALLRGLPRMDLLSKVVTLDAGLAHQPYTPQGGIEGATEKASAMRTASMLMGAIAKATGVVDLKALLSGRGSDQAAIEAGYHGVKELANPEYDATAQAEPASEHGYRGAVDLIIPAPLPNTANPGHITSNYRIFRPVVDQAACTACRICWVSCPDACISVDADKDEKVRIELAYCKGCGICWEVCPRHCIAAQDEVNYTDGVVRITY